MREEENVPQYPSSQKREKNMPRQDSRTKGEKKPFGVGHLVMEAEEGRTHTEHRKSTIREAHRMS